MLDISWLPIALVYPLTSLSDGCLIIATALAATLGGRPLLWGASFGLAHFTYAIIGMFAISRLNASSEIVGDVFVLLGACLLLRHSLHHQFKHRPGGGCGCTQHPHSASFTTMLSTAFGLSLHAIASGAIAEQLGAQLTTGALLTMVFVTAAMIGTIVGVVVQIGELERTPLTKFFDKIPGLVSGALVFVIGWCLHHLLEHMVELGNFGDGILLGAIGLAAGVTAYTVHERTHAKQLPTIVTLSSRKA